MEFIDLKDYRTYHSVKDATFIFGLIFLLTRIIDKPVGVLKGTLIDAQKEKRTQDYERTTSSYFYSLTIMFESEKIVLQGISSSNLKAGDSVDWTFKIDTEVLLVKYQKGGWLTIPLK